jgi:hypothetical protein
MMQLQVSTLAMEMLCAASPSVPERPPWAGSVESFTGIPIILCEEWEPGTWALVDTDGSLIDSGVFRP